MLEAAYQKLHENKKQYLKELLGVRTVNNEVRKIYKAKTKF